MIEAVFGASGAVGSPLTRAVEPEVIILIKALSKLFFNLFIQQLLYTF